MLPGPSIAGILMTGLVGGKGGLRELLSQLLKWRVGARWYAVALLTYPLTMTAILAALALISPQVFPTTIVPGDGVTLLLSGIVAGLAAGIFEELGWTGFAIPRLRLRYGVVVTGLIVGLLWGAWHFPLFTSSTSSASAVAPVLTLAVLLFSFLPPFRVLMVWVYERTQSLLVAILMHASFAGSTVVLALAAPSLPAVTYDLVLATVLWVVVAAVAVANHGHIARQSLRQQGV
jgi:membrane protease YdiL (CAAX protease family)